MAGGMLKASCIGNLGGDPETRFLDSGQAVCSFSVACNTGSRDKEHTEWLRVSAWGKLAEICQQYLGKGRKVYVEGRLTTRSFEGKDGVTRFSLELSASDVQLIDGKRDDDGGPARMEVTEDLDAIPF